MLSATWAARLVRANCTSGSELSRACPSVRGKEKGEMGCGDTRKGNGSAYPVGDMEGKEANGRD